MLKTSDGGSTWEIRQNELQCVFDDIYFYSNRIGYAIANAPNGIFYKSTDGGINWKVIDLKNSILFLQKFFAKDKMAWIAGSDIRSKGIIFKGILDLELFSNSEHWQRVLVDPNAYKRDGKQYPYSPYPSKNGAIKLMNYGKTTVTLDEPEVIKDIKGNSFKAIINGNIVSLNQNNNLSVLLANRNLFAGNELTIPVFFDPKEAGYHRLEIRFDNNSDVAPITVLEGYGGFPIISTSDLDFGNVEVGTGSVEKTVNFNFLNWEFDYPLTITDFVVDNNKLFSEKSGNGIFKWDRNNIVDKYGNSVTLPVTIGKDDYLTITGEYEPTESGEFSVRLTTVSNAEIEAVSTWTGAAIVSSVKDKNQHSFSVIEISPNPASDFITIRFQRGCLIRR